MKSAEVLGFFGGPAAAMCNNNIKLIKGRKEFGSIDKANGGLENAFPESRSHFQLSVDLAS